MVYLQGKSCVIHTWALLGWSSHKEVLYKCSTFILPLYLYYLYTFLSRWEVEDGWGSISSRDDSVGQLVHVELTVAVYVPCVCHQCTRAWTSKWCLRFSSGSRWLLICRVCLNACLTENVMCMLVFWCLIFIAYSKANGSVDWQHSCWCCSYEHFKFWRNSWTGNWIEIESAQVSNYMILYKSFFLFF